MIKKVGTVVVLAFFIWACDNYYEKRKKPTPQGNLSEILKQPVTHNESLTRFNKCWLRKNRFGLWEMYVEGEAYPRGVSYGLLCQELMKKQEAVFYGQIQKIVPHEKKLHRLLKIVAWYNRNLPYYFIPEYQQELLGTSYFMSDEFDWAGPKYFRALNLHGAHDIGHALQDLMLVGCTSFAAWGQNTQDGKMLLGRNFDFYAGEGFSEEKMVVFMNPKHGHKFMMVSWPGFLGAVSGMNSQGLTVTINAGKSKIPKSTGTPISILTREILQYASTIDEAVEIAKSRKTFVSESILVGSAKDGKAVIIEKSPKKQGVFTSDEPQLVCSNHFQSQTFSKDKKNTEHRRKWHSQYRQDRMNELLAENGKLNYIDVAEILRERDGLNGKKIGYGNEKAINQMMAHHGIIFKPEELKVWVSANPYQMGEFVCYDLNEVFEMSSELKTDRSIDVKDKTIPADPFIHSNEFKNYLMWRELEKTVDKKTNENKTDLLSEEEIDNFMTLNPHYYLANYKLGKYFESKMQYAKACQQYEVALSKEISTVYEVEEIESRLKKCRKKVKQ